jgi:hypothetical protein
VVLLEPLVLLDLVQQDHKDLQELLVPLDFQALQVPRVYKVPLALVPRVPPALLDHKDHKALLGLQDHKDHVDHKDHKDHKARLVTLVPQVPQDLLVAQDQAADQLEPPEQLVLQE